MVMFTNVRSEIPCINLCKSTDMEYKCLMDVPIGNPPMDYEGSDALREEYKRPLLPMKVYQCPRCRSVKLVPNKN